MHTLQSMQKKFIEDGDNNNVVIENGCNQHPFFLIFNKEKNKNSKKLKKYKKSIDSCEKMQYYRKAVVQNDCLNNSKELWAISSGGRALDF